MPLNLIRDISALRPFSRAPISLSASPAGEIRGLRIGLVRELLDTEAVGVDPQSADAVRAAAEVLSGLGAQVKEISLPLVRHTGAIVRTITHTERVSLHPEWLRERPQDYHPNTRVAFMAGNLIPAQVYYKAQKLRAVVRQQAACYS